MQLARHPGPPPGAPAGGPGDFSALARALGWRRSPSGAQLPYQDFIAGDCGPGFFPTLRRPASEAEPAWSDRWRRTAMSVHIRLREQAKTP